jgi:tripartite-type tricarboxylate transporter receptor subunit TctC
VNDPAVRKQLLAIGAEPVGNTPAEMAEQIKLELSTYGALVKQTKLSVE